MALLGRGGHAKVVLDLLRNEGAVVAGWIGPAEPSNRAAWRGLPWIGDDAAALRISADAPALALGMGDIATRSRLLSLCQDRGFAVPALVHSAAWVSPTTVLGAGVQVMAGAIAQADTELGAGTLLNTGARLDHDSRIGRCCHLAPGSTVCGGVTIGDEVMVGAGAVILPGIEVGPGAVIGAGAVVIRSVPAGVALYSVPAQQVPA